MQAELPSALRLKAVIYATFCFLKENRSATADEAGFTLDNLQVSLPVELKKKKKSKLMLRHSCITHL